MKWIIENKVTGERRDMSGIVGELDPYCPEYDLHMYAMQIWPEVDPQYIDVYEG